MLRKKQLIIFIILVLIFANPFCVGVFASSMAFHPNMNEGTVSLVVEASTPASQKCTSEMNENNREEKVSLNPIKLPNTLPYSNNGNLECCKNQSHHQTGTLEQASQNDSRIVIIPSAIIPDFSFDSNNFSNYIYSQYYAPPHDGYGLLTVIKKE